MGKNVNIVLSDGRVVSVPTEHASRLAAIGIGKPETDQAAATRAADVANEDRASGVGQGIKAAIEGGADALTGGLYGKVASYGDPDYGAEMQNRGEYRPGARFVGEAAAMLAPTGLLGRGVKGATELSLPGLASKAGKAIGGGAGHIVEGALIGVGAHVAETNVTGDPLTIEGVVESAGIGGLLNYGMGVASEKLTGIGRRAALAKAEGDVVRRDVVLAKTGNDVFSNPPASWQSFTDAVDANARTLRDAHRAAVKETEVYESFATGPKFKKAITQTEQAVNTVSNYWRKEGVEATTLVGGADGVQREMTPGLGNQRRKPPVSPEMSAKLKDWRDRIRKVDQMRTGGWDTDATQGAGRWVKSPGAPANPKGALEELRALQDEIKGFPKAERVNITEVIPRAPSSAPTVDVGDLRLPKNPRELAKMRPESIERIANLVRTDPAATAAFAKVAEDLGVQVGDGVAGLHAELGKYVGAIDRLAATARAPETTGGFLSFLGSQARYSVLGGVGAAIGGVLMRSKAMVLDRVRSGLSKWAVPAASAAKNLGPITAYLGASFPSGDSDPEIDKQKQAVNRINDVIRAGYTAPDVMFYAMEPTLGDPSEVDWKAHQHVTNALRHLAEKAPKDPGLNMRMGRSEWTPALHETIAFAHRLEAVLNPMGTIERSLAGDGHPAGVETLWTVWPNMMAHAAGEFAATMPQGLGHKRESAYSQLFRTPLTPLQQPSIVLALQGMYLPKPPKAPPAGGSPTGGRPGRPAAVQSEVAGSSVSKLIGS